MKALGKRSLAYGLKILLNIAWVVQLILFSILVCGILVKFFTSPDYTINGWPVALPPGSYTTNVTSASPDIHQVAVTVKEASLTFQTQHNWQPMVIALIGLSFGFGTSLAVTCQLRKIFATLTNTQPFVTSNATRLRRIAFILIAFSPISWLLSLFTNQFIHTHFTAKGVSLSFQGELNLNEILTGLVVLVIAEIFKLGIQLKQEQDLTI